MDYYVLAPGVLCAVMCIETFPCQHDMIIDKRRTTMSAPEIKQLLRSRGLPFPEHFKDRAPDTTGLIDATELRKELARREN